MLRDIRCVKEINAYDSGGILNSGQVTELCTETCYNSLENAKETIDRACTAKTDVIVYQNIAYPGIYLPGSVRLLVSWWEAEADETQLRSSSTTSSIPTMSHARRTGERTSWIQHAKSDHGTQSYWGVLRPSVLSLVSSTLPQLHPSMLGLLAWCEGPSNGKPPWL